MFGMNVEWDHQQQQNQGHSRHRQQPSSSNNNGGFFSNLFGGKKEEEPMKSGHVYYYSSSSRPNAPRRAETISVLPAGVKMPTGDKPEVSYGADGSKYLVIPPRRSNSTSRQIVVTSGRSTPKRKDSTASAHHHRDARATPRRSNSTQVRPTSPPVSSRPKIVGDPELVKQYENSQRNVARWVESVADSNSPRTPGRSRRTSTR